MTSQSTRNTAIFTAIHTKYLLNGTSADTLRESDRALVTYAPIIAGVLIVLLSGISFGVCMLMREKRKRIQEATSLHNLPWIDQLEVFTVTGREAAGGMFLPPATPGVPSPPPAYDSVVKMTEKENEAKKEVKPSSELLLPPGAEANPRSAPPTPSAAATSDDLPSYEAAVKMEGNL